MDVMTRLRSQWDRTMAGLVGLAGVTVLVLGWFGVSGTAYPAEQLPYIISGGIGGLFLLGLSTALWLSADLHDEWRKLDRIEQSIREAGESTNQSGLGQVADPDGQTQQVPQVTGTVNS